MKLALILVCGAVCSIARAQQIREPQLTPLGIAPAEETRVSTASGTEWKVADMEKDDDGVIWAIAMLLDLRDSERGSPGEIRELAIFDEETKSWKRHACEAAKDGVALGLQRLSDGSVACLWRSGQQSILTKHRQSLSSAWAVLDVVFEKPRLSAGRSGELWITEKGPKVARIPADGQTPAVMTIPDALLTAPEKPEEGSRNHAAVDAVQMGDGSVWLWSYSLEPMKNLWRISGFLRLKDDVLEKLPTLPFDPASTLSAVVADGADHLYAAEAGATLWRLPVAGGAAQRIEAPDQMFAYIEQLAFLGADLHMVTCPRPDAIDVAMSTTVKNHLELRTTHHYDTARPTGAIYRLQSPNVEEIATSLDDKPGFGRSPRSLVSTPAGMMIGSARGGPTWIAPDAEPRRIGREYGFVLRDAIETIPLQKSQWLVRATDTSWVVVGTTPLADPAPDRATVVKTIMPVVQDTNHDFWAWRQGEDGFAKWSGGKWNQASPPPVPADECLDLATDQHGQAWLISRGGGKSAVLDLASGGWASFDSPGEAIEKKLAPGDTVRIPRFLVFSPVSHSNGSKGYLDWGGTVHVFQSGAWTRTPLSGIARPKSAVSGAPFFDGEGRFVVPVENRHYRLRAAGGWEQVQNADTENDRTHEGQRASPPRDSPVTNVTSTAYDRHGIAWMTQRDGSLWKGLDGVATEVAGDKGTKPLPPHTSLEEVLVDELGTAMLRCSGSPPPFVYLCLAPCPRDLLEKPTVDHTATGVPRIAFPKVAKGWHRYRINDGAWSRPAREDEAILTTLVPGRHRLAVQFFDRELTPLGIPAEIAIHRDPAGADAIRELIARLQTDSLDEREEVAGALRIQGACALPHLNESLQAADEGSSLHWWLKATVQGIERGPSCDSR